MTKKPMYLLARFDYWMREAFANEQSTLYRIVNDIVVLLIFFSIGSIIVASVEDIYLAHQKFFDVSEMIVVGIFTIEYLANIYVAENKLKYILGPWGIIDILAIVPSYLNVIDLRAIKVFRVLRVLRFLRLMRMLRLLKLAKHVTKGHEHEHKVNKFDTLKMDLQIYFIALFSVVVIFSTLMYYAERGIEGTPFTTIPHAMWWCIVTITTVGYGDMYPTGVLGRLIAAVTMLCGLALFGLLMNVIGKYMMTSLFGATELEEVNIQEMEKKVKGK
ncbi:ion transporter [Patescibacteria group bacterium]|nr:ion transporter [Patescibacteria group bacterium]MBU1683437.1 ion transporter [Patescibacteria group bacterium]MBU1934955.1 ion transporter [Patescibacteria group bacterium]